MLSEKICQTLANDITDGFINKTSVKRVSSTCPEMTPEEAYSIQQRVINHLKNDKKQIKGYKIGLTSTFAQEIFGIQEPVYAPMFADLFLSNQADQARTTWVNPMVELELAFIMKDKLSGKNISQSDVFNATDYIVPAIEIADSRLIAEPGINGCDLIADLAAVGSAIVGLEQHALKDLDINNLTGTLWINGEEKASGNSSAVLGSPLTSITWLANKLSEHGKSLLPGDVILSGSFFPATPINAGDNIIAKFAQNLGELRMQVV